MSDATEPVARRALYALNETAKVLTASMPFCDVPVGGDVLVELYAPVGADRQQPHTRDELYFVAVGHGTFRRGADLFPFGPGDCLFVAAHVPHRFETFSPDFKVWVVFFGPECPAPSAI